MIYLSVTILVLSVINIFKSEEKMGWASSSILSLDLVIKDFQLL